MVQNLKVDILYHKSASDFEMEFNLCGCCRMRLLSDKTNDKKSFIKALARDVSRSRIIIACGPLFGAEGITKMVAAAIGGNTVACNNKTYGINSDDEIQIINGSTPLVTPDGYFGGCIIESGPQTIILLTENKAFRKTIMQNLIHPYIEEICYIPTKSPFVANSITQSDSEEAIAEAQAYLTETDDNYDVNEPIDKAYEAAQNTADVHNIEFIMDTGDEAEEEKTDGTPMYDENYQIYTEVETPEEIEFRYKNPYVPSESDEMFLSNTENEEAINYKGKSRSLDITIVVLVLLLLLSILALVYFVVLKPGTVGLSTVEYLKQIFGIASEATSQLQ